MNTPLTTIQKTALQLMHTKGLATVCVKGFGWLWPTNIRNDYNQFGLSRAVDASLAVVKKLSPETQAPKIARNQDFTRPNVQKVLQTLAEHRINIDVSLLFTAQRCDDYNELRRDLEPYFKAPFIGWPIVMRDALQNLISMWRHQIYADIRMLLEGGMSERETEAAIMQMWDFNQISTRQFMATVSESIPVNR